MFDIQSLHVAMLVWGGIFSLIATVCMILSRNFDREKRKWMVHMQLVCAVLLFSDAFAWGLKGRMGIFNGWMIRISNFLVFFFSDLLLLLFHNYVCSELFEKAPEKKDRAWQVRAVNALACVAMVLVIFSQFTHFYYNFDSYNRYYRNPGYIVSLILPMLGMLLDLSMIIQYRRQISQRILTAMISYTVLPIIASAALLFYYGISLANIAICISMILMFVTAMIEQNEHLAQKEKEAADLRISITLSQIAPHFIYNSLTAIQYLCETDPPEAKKTVGNFARYLRGNLDSLSEKDPILFDRELEHVRYYLALEEKRFGDRVKVVYDIQKTGFPIPALTLQPLVENAVKHGLCKKTEGGTVVIRTWRQGEMAHIVVKDNGVGFDPQKISADGKNHVGIANVRSRLESMCGGTMKIESIPGKGTKVEIIVPEMRSRHENNSSRR